MTVGINHIIFVLVNGGMALYHDYLIDRNKPIKHGLWATIYLLICCLFGYLFSWWYIPMMLCFRGWYYTPFLNSIREKPIAYWSLTSTSIIDKIERKIFKKFWIARLFYIAGWVICLIIVLLPK